MKRFVLIALAACFSLTACQKAKTPEALGKAYFYSYGCTTCHRIGSEGGNVGPDLTYIGYRKSEEWLRLWMKDPKAWKPDTNMPTLHLNETALNALVAYMFSLKGEDYKGEKAPWKTEALKDDPVKRGEAIFNRVGCTGCHGTAGIGGFPNNNVVGGKIPSLKFVSDGYSKEELKEKIHKGVPESSPEDPSQPKPMIHMPAWGEVLGDEELDALVEYLFSLRPASSPSDSWGN